ncbi:hypothetical protein DL764_004170 [Monosporascus ibericus]|uniref:U6 small nuclear RNA (adenine-(43)-N(6))-methyltransferase n=1 Tax=Monosporascus ibericus TaxID=155417 RepID=A0A4Q4TH94_9PEZI|nr:hypothetical protein DL764_004170 [Monosporascus ibericus]
MDSPNRNRGTKRRYSGDQDAWECPDDATSAHPSISPIQAHTKMQSTDIGGDKNHESYIPAGAEESPDACQASRVPASTVTASDDEYYRTLYSRELDFHALGERDRELGSLLQGGSRLDFANPLVVMQLTKTLLRLHFGLRVDLPLDRLCPPVPNRHNYILWLKDLLDSSSTSYSQIYEPERPVEGLDIGTGASLVYPLLACAQRPAWTFIATDVDAKSIAYARRNAELNSLQSRIRVVSRDIAAPLIPLDDLNIETIDFVMVNPPFYASESELLDLARQKSRPPHSACTGAPIEMVCEGGEVGFVRRIIDESLILRRRVQWYTAMLGKQSSLDVLVSLLKENGIDNYAMKTFVQGNKTRRWALGWSFHCRRPSLRASRGVELAMTKNILPFPTEVTALRKRVSCGIDPEQLERKLRTTMETLDLVSWNWDTLRKKGVGFADGNVWSRAYRRRKERQNHMTTAPPQRDEASADKAKTNADLFTRQKLRGVVDCAFGFALSIRVEHGSYGIADEVTLAVRWLQGHDYSLFESFTGMLRNAILRTVRDPDEK